MERITIDGWDFGADQILTPAEVGRMFGVDPRTVTRWAQQGLLACVRTPTGQHRYSQQQVLHIMTGAAISAGDGAPEVAR